MTVPEEACLLRIFVGEDERIDYRPVYETIVLKARAMGLAGATVLRGPMGYGAGSHLHTTKILRLSEDLPMIIEIVETEERIQAFLAEVSPMIKSGLATLEKVRVQWFGAPRTPAT